ncbi:hypothetical protein HPP92_007471 [Vanilla planifolia]|uniref:BTB domain-containing protein n=1 Tax=Vanilla planifolia TaxID=51239 RepID=A0A835RQY3_VANPL|nr:hypothetical protein HPP92_007471 [Vanilla planifolia]
MEQDFFQAGGEQNFEFAFNSSNFSDRVLRIEVVGGPSERKAGDDGCGSISDWARHRKRRREDNRKDKDFEVCNTNHILDWNEPDAEDILAYENTDDEAVAMIEETLSVDELSLTNDYFLETDNTVVLKVNSIFISSAILAAKSPFFYKLFSNGMRESDQRHVTLRVYESEEAAVMELLSFMYSGKFSTTSPALLLDVLMVADKFEVASCMRHCSQLLRSFPMTAESALLYLELPSNISMASAVQPLTDAAKEFLANKFRDIAKYQDEVMNLPLAGIEAILSSDHLQISSEDAVYDLMLKWARVQYPKLEERREILVSRLLPLIRLPFMTCRKLKKVLVCNDLDHDVSFKAVMDALFFKADTPHNVRMPATYGFNSNSWFIERGYRYRPVKVVDFELPHLQCVVYLDLKREECANLFPSGRVYSQAFFLGGQGFFLSGHCNMDMQTGLHCFGLFLGMQEKGSVSFTVDYEFAARTKPTDEFVSKYKGFYTFTGGKAVGYRNLFGIPWTSFLAEDSIYFLNGSLHLRAELTIKQPPPLPQP